MKILQSLLLVPQVRFLLPSELLTFPGFQKQRCKVLVTCYIPERKSCHVPWQWLELPREIWLPQPGRTILQLLGGDSFFPAEIHPCQKTVTSPALKLYADHISLDRVSWYNLDGWLTISCAFRKSYATQILHLEEENSFSLVIKYKNTAQMWWW